MNSPATSSGLLSADGVIMAAPGRLRAVQLLADGTNACNIVLYDNASAASGTVLAKISVKATDTHSEIQFSDTGVVANNGIYADVTGTGAAFIVYYDRG